MPCRAAPGAVKHHHLCSSTQGAGLCCYFLWWPPPLFMKGSWALVSPKAHVDLPEMVSNMLVCMGFRGSCDGHLAAGAPPRLVLCWAGPVVPQSLWGLGVEVPSAEV